MFPAKRNLLPTVSRFFGDDWNDLFDWNSRNYSSTTTSLPAVNIRETGDSFVVEMAAPGMQREDFDIELHNNVLTIRSEVTHQNEENEGNDDRYTRREFSYQSFQRSFNLNDRVVDDAKIEASYRDGILHLQIPKREEAKQKPARRIEVA